MTLLLVIALLTAVPSYSYAQAPKPVRVVTTSLLGMSIGMMVGAVIATMSGNFSSGPVVIGAAVGFGIGLVMSLTTEADDPQAQNYTIGTQDTSSGSMQEKVSAVREPSS